MDAGGLIRTGAGSESAPSDASSGRLVEEVHTVIIGAGAAGLMAAIWSGRSAPDERILLLDSAFRPGSKILISGGGRCNVTHHAVDPRDFAGSSRNAIGKVLRAFDVPRTRAFFEEIGVELKREETGKFFPVTDSARTVLDSLLAAATEHAELRRATRVEMIAPARNGFDVITREGTVRAERVILATGGRSIPKSGSDGHGYNIARALGHSVTRRFPALVPLTLERGHWLMQLSGLTAEAELTVHSCTGKKLHIARGAVLCTHFGLSGPAVLDISRYLIEAQMHDADSFLTVNWLPGQSPGELAAEWKQSSKAGAGRSLRRLLPNRLANALLQYAGVDPGHALNQISREQRSQLADAVAGYRLPVSGNRGYNYAEVTAGGVPLTEIDLKTMESRILPGLHLCGEICDVDGRIGGFNFQWAWSSGYLAGVGSQRVSV